MGATQKTLSPDYSETKGSLQKAMMENARVQRELKKLNEQYAKEGQAHAKCKMDLKKMTVERDGLWKVVRQDDDTYKEITQLREKVGSIDALKQGLVEEGEVRKMRDDEAMRIFQDKTMDLRQEHANLKISAQNDARHLKVARERLDFLENAFKQLEGQNATVVGEFLRLWGCVAEDESVYDAKHKLSMQVKEDENQLKAMGSEVKVLRREVERLQKACRTEKDTAKRWKQAMIEEEHKRVKLHDKIAALQEELALYRKIQDADEKASTKKRLQDTFDDRERRQSNIKRMHQDKREEKERIRAAAEEAAANPYGAPPRPKASRKESSACEVEEHLVVVPGSVGGEYYGENQFGETKEVHEEAIPGPGEQGGPNLTREVNELHQLQKELETLKKISENRSEIRDIAEQCSAHPEDQYDRVLERLEFKQQGHSLLAFHDKQERRREGQGKVLEDKLSAEEEERRINKKKLKEEKKAKMQKTMLEARGARAPKWARFPAKTPAPGTGGATL